MTTTTLDTPATNLLIDEIRTVRTLIQEAHDGMLDARDIPDTGTGRQEHASEECRTKLTRHLVWCDEVISKTQAAAAILATRVSGSLREALTEVCDHCGHTSLVWQGPLGSLDEEVERAVEVIEGVRVSLANVRAHVAAWLGELSTRPVS